MPDQALSNAIRCYWYRLPPNVWKEECPEAAFFSAYQVELPVRFSHTGVAEIVFGVEIVEWDLCSACLSRTGFLEFFNSLPSATPREAEEIKILLGISNETFERQNRAALPIN